MKRRFANRVSGDYFQEKLNNEYFIGYVTHIKIKNIKEPVIVNNGQYELCIIKNGYDWIGLYPCDENYALTIMVDENGEVIQWYFDISKEIGIENGVPYEDDLYLDMIITKEKEKIIADEDELLEAEKNGVITKEDVNNAYETLKYIEDKYFDNISELFKLTTYLLDRFNIKK